jgi:hypothetical protein
VKVSDVRIKEALGAVFAIDPSNDQRLGDCLMKPERPPDFFDPRGVGLCDYPLRRALHG